MWCRDAEVEHDLAQACCGENGGPMKVAARQISTMVRVRENNLSRNICKKKVSGPMHSYFAIARTFFYLNCGKTCFVSRKVMHNSLVRSLRPVCSAVNSAVPSPECGCLFKANISGNSRRYTSRWLRRLGGQVPVESGIFRFCAHIYAVSVWVIQK